MTRKLLYAVRGGNLLCINADHAMLVKSRDEIILKTEVEKIKAKDPVCDLESDGDDNQDQMNGQLANPASP